MDQSSLFTILVVALAIGIPFFIVFLWLGLPPIIRWYIKSTGQRARAVILEAHSGRGAIYSGSEYNHHLVAQKMILKLEVHPTNGATYIAEDRFMVKAMDLMKLTSGCDVQVYIARNNPKWVVSLPETITASPNASVQARANLAMANLAQQAAHGGGMSPQDVMNALQAQGLHTHPMSSTDDPKAKLEKLKDMLNSGLITQQEYDIKKNEILANL